VDKFVTIKPKYIHLMGNVGTPLIAVVEILTEEKYPFQITGIRADKEKHIQFELE
jgi:hypothetical protein